MNRQSMNRQRNVVVYTAADGCLAVAPAAARRSGISAWDYMWAVMPWCGSDALVRVTRRQLAAEMCCTERTAQSRQQKAVQLGLIEVVCAGTGRQTQELRVLCLDAAELTVQRALIAAGQTRHTQ